MSGSLSSFALADGIDREALTAAFKRDGHVQIQPFLRPSVAAMLAEHLRDRLDWQFVFNAREKVFEVPRTGAKALSRDDEARLRGAIDQDAVTGFHYCFESIRVPDAGRSPDDPVHAFAEFLCSEAVLSFFRDVTGCAVIDFADAQATAYASGDFLTAHDDEVAGKSRRAAYVLSLTPEWRTEWGGILAFHDERGDVRRGYSPRLNALSLFTVPQVHSVSRVIPGIRKRRYSITGWLRS